MEPIIQWQNKSGKWTEFDNSDISHMPRNHAIHLFSLGTPVVIKEGEQYIVNSTKLMADYKAKKKPVMLLSDCVPSELQFNRVGFLGAAN